MNELNYIAFESCVAKIFEKAEYSIERDVQLDTEIGDIDIVAKKDKKKLCGRSKVCTSNRESYWESVLQCRKA